MDTKTAIATLQTEFENIGAEISTLNQKQQALSIAISQLQGTLTTQLSALSDAEATIATLQATPVNTQPTSPSVDVPVTPVVQ